MSSNQSADTGTCPHFNNECPQEDEQDRSLRGRNVSAAVAKEDFGSNVARTYLRPLMTGSRALCSALTQTKQFLENDYSVLI